MSRKREPDSPAQPPTPKRQQPTLMAFCKANAPAEPAVVPPPAPPPEPVAEAPVEPPAPPAAEGSPLNDFGRCVGKGNLSDAQKHALIERHWVPKSHHK